VSDNSYKMIKSLLASSKPGDVRRGLKLVREEIAREGTNEARPLFEMVTAIFYIDPLDRPDLVPVIDEAINLVVGFGKWIIPVLVENLDAGDFKVQLAISHALGRIGADAIKPLINEFHTTNEPTIRAFILYAMGKIKSHKIVQALPLIIEAAQSPDPELRDTATRAIGKLVESIPLSDLSDEQRLALIERLTQNLGDSNAGIRAKAVRSFGKLAKYGHLTSDEKEKLNALCQLILGIDENFEWDRAYIVRKEAEEALNYVKNQMNQKR